MTLKELIIRYREENGLSQRQFATACGLSNGYISMIEREANPKTGEKITPTLQALQKLATGMNTSLSELLALVDDMPVNISAENKSTPVSDCGLDVLSDAEIELITNFRTLNDEGQEKVLTYVGDLVQIELYKNDYQSDVVSKEA
jgi:transcriptional regulator with XRE-family HTH domain